MGKYLWSGEGSGFAVGTFQFYVSSTELDPKAFPAPKYLSFRIIANSYVQSQVPKMRGIRLESKPVSYSWFLSQVGPQVSNPGLWDEAGMRYILPPSTIITFPGKMPAFISLSGTGICGEEDFRCR
jgi:hypothetical protein